MDDKTTGGGMSLLGTLTLIFVVLKLLKIIDWSWWWILFPTWFPIVTLLAFILIALILSALSD